MNVFRNRKKSVSEADGHPSLEKAPPVPTPRGRAIFRRKQQPEPKPEIDLNLALPSTDDFRTSLLMPNLSARFSMLREQDDPSSLLGKASDDSVLFPKRSSRLDLFGLGTTGAGLDDIAEVSSISDRRPFIPERNHTDSMLTTGSSVSDEEARNLNGSIMSRAKPGHGNNTFGGRQKVLMIPVSGGRSTKAVYNDDVSYNHFQELKRRERERRKEAEEAGDYFDEGDRSSQEQDRHTRRETTSSTNSNQDEGRSSTAATSIASQFGSKNSPVGTPGERPGQQKKRLYGQGLDQQLQEQQSSAMSRLNSLQRGFQRNGVAASRSATSLNQQFRSSSPFSPVLRSGSPSPVVGGNAFGGFDFGVAASRTRSASRDTENFRGTPPMSPMSPQSVGSPVDPMLVAALEPNDVGKATASGAFNKPKGPFNEQQFAQRQLQLQEGRNTPPLRSMSRAESASEQSARLRNGSFASARSGQSSRQQFRPGSATSRAASETSSHPTPLSTGHDAFLVEQSGSEYGSGPNSPALPMPAPAPEVFAEPRLSASSDRRRPAAIAVQVEPRTKIKSSANPTAPAPITSPETLLTHTPGAPSVIVATTPAPAADPIPPPPATAHLGSGLNDLVRGHLRQDSGASSIYPASPGEPPAEFLQDSATSAPTEEESRGLTAQESMSMRAKQILERANQLASSSSKPQEVLGSMQQDKVQQILGAEALRRSSESSRPVPNHARGVSAETQQEREEFASELAERRKQVHDNLMRMEENSPHERGSENSPAKNRPFGLLKKASRGSLAANNETNGMNSNASSKALKMLGMGENGNEAPSPRSHTPSQPEERRTPPSSGPVFRERNIGNERRERFMRKGAQHPTAQNFERPGMPGPAPFPPGQYGYGRAQPSPTEANSFYPAGRARKYSPPGTKPPLVSVPPPPGQRVRASPDRPRVGGMPPNSSYFPPQHPSPPRQAPNGQGMSDGGRRGPSPPNPAFANAGYATNRTPPIEHPPHFLPTTNPAVAAQNAQATGRSRKKSVSKHEISEPTFISGGSAVSTIDLPPGASLSTGHDEIRSGAPPLPAMNPNRHRGARIPTTQNIFTAFGGPAMNESQSQPSSAHADQGEFPSPREQMGYSDSENPPRFGKARPRLRSAAAEGGSAAKARHHALMREAESVPEGMDGYVNGIGGHSSHKRPETHATPVS